MKQIENEKLILSFVVKKTIKRSNKTTSSRIITASALRN